MSGVTATTLWNYQSKQ